jgi:glyoxylase-like metal-dependent hydrolase (beta-lactamase superfamily II)
MATIPFVPPLDVQYGAVEQVSPLIRRVVAENPSKFTYRGTGTYIVGHGRVAVIDPGPELESHRTALTAALADDEVTHILVTHCHADHSPLAAWLRERTGAPTLGFGPHGAISFGDGDAPPGPGIARATDHVVTEEAVDTAFEPDIRLTHAAVVAGAGWTIEAVHTPGHTSNHLCFALQDERALFSGDHVMGWSTTVIAPPDGDMRAYLASLDLILGRDDAVYWPTHGGPVTEPKPYVEAYLAHRLERERQVLGCVRRGVGDIHSIVAELYAGVPEDLHEAAGRSVLAHLVKLVDDGLVHTDTAPSSDATFAP